MSGWIEEFLTVGALLLIVGIIVKRLPKVDIGHSVAFTRRRFFNWLLLGLSYAFLYMGRYNLATLKDVGTLTEQHYGRIFLVGAIVYGISFLINGPLTDRWGGRKTIILATAGSAVMNALLGLFIYSGFGNDDSILPIMILYGANMYFQSFGAVAIVKVNSFWFHVRERGVLGGLFGILISLGIYFAFDWTRMIAQAFPMNLEFVFWIPAAILFVFMILDVLWIRYKPSEAGFENFNLGDATSDEGEEQQPALTVFRRMFANPVIVTIIVIEFCSGYLRNVIMHWYRDFAQAFDLKDNYVYEHWGMLLCMAGIVGGMFAGILSDRVFSSRRGPVAAALYGLMIVGSIILLLFIDVPISVGWIVVCMSMCIIGVHGMLSGVASADFGGSKNVGITVGIIDGFVYLGTGLQSIIVGELIPAKGTPEAAMVDQWIVWPIAMLPAAVIGFAFALRIWNAHPKDSLMKSGKLSRS